MNVLEIPASAVSTVQTLKDRITVPADRDIPYLLINTLVFQDHVLYTMENVSMSALLMCTTKPDAGAGQDL
jgi:hypothetical protein